MRRGPVNSNIKENLKTKKTAKIKNPQTIDSDYSHFPTLVGLTDSQQHCSLRISRWPYTKHPTHPCEVPAENSRARRTVDAIEMCEV
jgi:hypothetical protein